MAELGMLYQNYCDSRSAELPLPVVQYSDFAVWQRIVISKVRLDAQVDYWRKTLGDCSVKLQLASDFTGTDSTDSKGAKQEVALPPELVSKLHLICQSNGVTLYMVLLSAYSVLLSGYTDQQDICVGSPVSKRSNAELDRVIGYFVNVVVMRLSINRDMKYIDLISKTKKVTVEAFANKDLPFSRVVEILRTETERTPLVNVMFNLIQIPDSQQTSSSLALIPVEISKDVTNFDLNLVLYETAMHTQGYLEYNADLFKQTTIETMLERYLHILKNVAQTQDVSVSQLLSESGSRLRNTELVE